jgi:hypothetical protein
MPSSVQARKMRMAISPRFAAITFLNFFFCINPPPLAFILREIKQRTLTARLLVLLKLFSHCK